MQLEHIRLGNRCIAIQCNKHFDRNKWRVNAQSYRHSKEVLGTSVWNHRREKSKSSLTGYLKDIFVLSILS